MQNDNKQANVFTPSPSANGTVRDGQAGGSSMKSLAKDTAIYGLSSIVGRFLNYLLVPLYTNVISAESGGYGAVTNLYAYVALILAILTFGMETTFFRFANKEGEKSDTVFSTSMLMVGGLSVLFFVLVAIFIGPIGEALRYPDHHAYILLMAGCVAQDGIQAIPFCHLRFQRRPMKFMTLKMMFICLNIGLNLIWFLWLKESDVYYVFLLNLICTSIISLMFVPDLLRIHWSFDVKLLRRMFSYSWPILILSTAAILNQAFDKMVFPMVYDKGDAQQQLGIYGACVKIAMIMAMITQAFRYAYEPLVFSIAKNKDSKQTYALGMKYFLIFTLLAFLCVMGYMDVLKHVIGPGYREGLRVVPIVMAAEIMMGISMNLSFWYKLIDKTIYGAWLALVGCAVLVLVNVIFVPQYGYMACAWGGVAGYGTTMLLSYFIGQKKNPIQYPMLSMGVYVLITAIFFTIMQLLPETWPTWSRLGINTLLIFAFIGHIIYHDLPLKNLPVVGKYFKK